MIKEITYRGYTATPDDYVSPDGDLALSINAINENNTIKPLANASVIGHIPDGWSAVYIHTNSAYRHLIVHNAVTNAIAWLDFPEGTTTAHYTTDDINTFGEVGTATLYKIVGVGNTLVVLTSEGLMYYLYKSATDGYITLGNRLPECEMAFTLHLDDSDLGILTSDDGDQPKHIQAVNTVLLSSNGYLGEVDIKCDDDNVTENTNAVLGSVNKVIQRCKEKGFFLNNFFVRYAFRLYDGSFTMHSAPILMTCASDRINPLVLVYKHTDDYKTGTIKVFAPKFKLRFKSLMTTADLEQWSDIITSVDIFASTEISNLNTSGSLSNPTVEPFDLLYNTGSGFNTGGYPEPMYCFADGIKSSYRDMLQTVVDANNRSKYWLGDSDSNYLNTVNLPKFSESNLQEQYHSASNFYLLHSCSISNLSSEFADVPLEDQYLTTLVNREQLSDDSHSHDSIIAGTAFVYNSRINLANISRIPFTGYRPESCYPYKSYANDSKYTSYRTHIFIRENGKEVVVSSDSRSAIDFEVSPFFFYPNTGAYRCVMEKIYTNIQTLPVTTTHTYYELPLKVHDFLNGAYYWNGYNTPEVVEGWKYEDVNGEPVGTFVATPPTFFPDFLDTTNEALTPTQDNIIEYPNKIYTAEAGNPFVFDSSNINSLTTSRILALSSVTKALSSGQFGQFPMYAFTADGIWALSTSSTGTIESMHPVTRDVCTNIDSITQIDDAVVFVSSRGIMSLQGSQTQCISSPLETIVGFNPRDLSIYNALPSEFTAVMPTLPPFRSFLDDCAILYDYTNQRLIVYTPATTGDKTPAFVYSLKSGLWGMTLTDIKISLNSYPNSLYVDMDNAICDYSTPNFDDIDPQVIFSRPLKLDAAETLKTVYTAIQRGHFRKGAVMTVLQGSRDLYNWFTIASSKDHAIRRIAGTPYKFFRLMLLCNLQKDESILGCSLQVNPKYTNRLR